MPLYYFDFADSGRVVPDNQGTELHGIEAAKHEAAKTLCEIVGEMLPGDPREFEINIRDEANRPLCAVAIKFEMRAHHSGNLMGEA
jgi:hypothetical protein